ncbi:MAG: 30S ribosomal protein S20 [Patescibacteria group bacterium]
MPNTSSAKKALRKSIRLASHNRAKEEVLHSIEKEIKQLVLSGKKADAKKLIARAYKLFDKAVKTEILKKNTASRKKSRLTKLVA